MDAIIGQDSAHADKIISKTTQKVTKIVCVNLIEPGLEYF